MLSINVFLLPAWVYNVQVEELSQKRVDDILKRGAGCHGNHMMRQAGLFKGIQLLLVFLSAPVQEKRQRRRKKGGTMGGKFSIL